MQSPTSKSVQIFAVVLVFGFLFGSYNVREVAAAEGKIAFVDLQKAIAGTKEWKKSFKSFKEKFTKEQQRIKVREDRIKKMLENLNKQSFVLDPDLKKKKEDEFRKAKVDFERYVQDKNAEFSVKEKEMTEKMLKQMIGVIKEIGKKKKYNMVIEHKALLYHNAADEITDLATKAYDNKYK
jgi:outer membrane protein